MVIPSRNRRCRYHFSDIFPITCFLRSPVLAGATILQLTILQLGNRHIECPVCSLIEEVRGHHRGCFEHHFKGPAGAFRDVPGL